MSPKQERALSADPMSASERLRTYALCTLLVGAAALIRHAVHPFVGEGVPYTFFVLPPVYAAMRWGVGPAAWSAVVGGVVAHFVLVPPKHDFAVGIVSELTSLSLFLLLVAAGVAVASSQRNARRLAEERLRQARAATEERTRARSELAVRQSLFQAVVDVSPALMYVKDPEGRYILANRAMERAVGVGTLIGKTDQEVFAADLAAHYRLNDRKALESSTPLETEEVAPGLNGELRTWASLRTRLVSAEGEVMGVCGVSFDVTDIRRANQKLRESENQFRQLADAIPQLVWTSKPSGEVEYFNRQTSAYTGVDAMTGEQWMAEVHPDDRDRVVSSWARCVANGSTYESEHRIRRHDGEYRWFLARAVPIRDAQGRIARWFGSCTDIHDAKQAEAGLKTVLESTTDSVFSVDAGWRITYVNQHARESISRDRDIIGMRLWDAFPEAVDTGFYREYHRAMTERVAVAFEEYYAPFDVWFEVHAYPAADGGLSIFFRDATERRAISHERMRMDRELREANRNLRALIEASPLAIVAMDGAGIVREWNAAAERLFGWQAVEVVGRPIPTIPEDRVAEYQGMVREAQRGKITSGFETVRRRKDGSLVEVSISDAPLRNREGEIDGRIIVVEDITERRRFEEQIRQTQKLESIGLLAGGIAHDFNNLLTAIIGNISMAIEGPVQYRERFLSPALKSAERAAELTRQLLAYAGKGAFVLEPVDLSDEIAELLTLIHASLPKRVSVRLQLEAGLPPVSADPNQIRQLLLNLVVNAAESVPEAANGDVWLRTFSDRTSEPVRSDSGPELLAAGGYVCLEVADNGCGMDEKTRRRMFEPFFTTKFTGRGLGLAAVSGIVRGLGGAIQVDSAPGEGTTVRVYLPARAPRTDAHTPAREQPSTRAATILIVDDEPEVVEFLRIALERAGYRIVVAPDGRQAVQILEAYGDAIRLVLMDVIMPVLDGAGASLEMFAKRPGLRILVTSGYDEREALKGFPPGRVAGFIQKPYTAERITAQVKEALSA